MSRGVAVLGSTGSIGTQTLDVIEALRGDFHVVSLAAGSNVELLLEQAERFRPRLVAVANEEKARSLRGRLPAGVRIAAGEEGVIEAALAGEAETVVAAIVGARGILPVLEALKAGRRVALANKETLVAAGPLVQKALAEGGGALLPVDSEHSAIFQCLEGEEAGAVRRLILTASGGPFRAATLAEMERAQAADALNHPTWRMGGKITIDSATLMNKGLEVIEAHWLFNMAFDSIDVVIHPQSIVHSMVEFVDGTVKAQLGAADMRAPIQHALTYPKRTPVAWSTLSFTEVGTLTFEAPDLSRFPCLALAYQAGRAGGTAPAALNAANEVAVSAFLAGRIGFMEIPRLVEEALAAHTPQPADRLEAVLAADAMARRLVEERIGGTVAPSISGRGDAP